MRRQLLREQLVRTEERLAEVAVQIEKQRQVVCWLRERDLNAELAGKLLGLFEECHRMVATDKARLLGELASASRLRK
jgi:hypothetical protein